MAGEIKKVLFSEGVSVAEPAAVDLAYTGTANVFTESQTLDNQKELRFREATANGTNYASIKAPASLAATYDLTLPTDDGSSGQVLQTDGSGVLSWTDGGGGSGEKNYITNPSAKSAITGWTNVGDLDVARTTTAGDLPREYTTASGIKITADANTQSTADYVYYDFTLDDVDLSKKLKIQWAQKTTGTYAAGDLAVVITTQADRTTALHTPITTAIPAVDGVFTTYFDASTTATLSLVIRATTDMTTDGGIVISDVVVGPGVGVQGPVVGKPETVTVTGAWISNTTYTAIETRNGQWAHYTVKVALSGAPTSASLSINLPSGRTIDTTALANSSASSALPLPNSVVGILDSGTAAYPGWVSYSSTTAVLIKYLDDAAAGVTISADVTQAAPFTFASGDIVNISFSVPIAEWAGSGTVNLAQNDVEYASNDGSGGTAAGATYNTGMAYGPSGSQFVAVNSTTANSNTLYKVSFNSIQTTDSFAIEVTQDGGTTWCDSGGPTAHTTRVLQYDSNYGMFIGQGGSNYIYVYFGNKGRLSTGVAYANDGAAWSVIAGSSTYKWRVKKTSGGQAVGFGTVSENSSGLMPYSHANLDNASATRLGLKQYLHGTTYNGGNAPTVSGTNWTTTRAVFVPYQLQDGTWRVRVNLRGAVSGGGAITSITLTFNGTTFKNVSNYYQCGSSFVVGSAPYTSACQAQPNSTSVYVYFASATNPEIQVSGDYELDSKPTWAY